MRIAINAYAASAGGGLTNLVGLLQGFQQLSKPPAITVFASYKETLEATSVSKCGADVIPVPRVPWVRRLAWEQTRLPRLLRRVSADVLLCTNFSVPLSPCPQVIQHQSLHVWSKWTQLRSWQDTGTALFQKMAARLSFHVADAHVFTSSFLYTQAQRFGGRVFSPSYVVPYGLSSGFQREVHHKVHVQPPTYRLAALQGGKQYKDNESLLQALRHLTGMHPEKPWRLDIAGPRDWDVWQRRAYELGVTNRVNWRGYLDEEEVIELLVSSDCLIYPSTLEAFGLPVIEAMACGCPVVAVQAAAVPEVAGNAAILVRPRSPKMIARKVVHLLDDKEYRHNLIAAGKSHARSFSWKKTARAFYDIFAMLKRY